MADPQPCQANSGETWGNTTSTGVENIYIRRPGPDLDESTLVLHQKYSLLTERRAVTPDASEEPRPLMLQVGAGAHSAGHHERTSRLC